MCEIKWIKVTTDIFDDEAINIIETMPEGDTIIVIWFKLLTKAGKLNNNGNIYFKEDIPYNEEMLATILKKPIEVIKLAIRTFENFGMIEINDKKQILIKNWEKHQNIAGMEQIKEYNRLAKRRQREKQKELKLLSQGQGQGQVKENHETDIDIDKNIICVQKEKNTENKTFKKPSIEEIKQYCVERKNNINAEYFYDYNEARDWKLSNKLKMKDWKAVVRTWERNNYQKQPMKNSDYSPSLRVI